MGNMGEKVRGQSEGLVSTLYLDMTTQNILSTGQIHSPIQWKLPSSYTLLQVGRFSIRSSSQPQSPVSTHNSPSLHSTLHPFSCPSNPTLPVGSSPFAPSNPSHSPPLIIPASVTLSKSSPHKHAHLIAYTNQLIQVRLNPKRQRPLIMMDVVKMRR